VDWDAGLGAEPGGELADFAAKASATCPFDGAINRALNGARPGLLAALGFSLSPCS
jgi:hypothetical protein